MLRLLSSLFFPYLFSSATKNFRIILYVLDLICRRFLVFSSLLYCWNIDPTSKEPSVNHFLCYFKEIVVKLASMRSSTKFEIVLCNSDFYFYFFRTWLRQWVVKMASIKIDSDICYLKLWVVGVQTKKIKGIDESIFVERIQHCNHNVVCVVSGPTLLYWVVVGSAGLTGLVQSRL